MCRKPPESVLATIKKERAQRTKDKKKEEKEKVLKKDKEMDHSSRTK
jgi:hypothetical protein